MFNQTATLFVDLTITTSKCCSYVPHIIIPKLLSCYSNFSSPQFSNRSSTWIGTLATELEGDSNVLTRGKKSYSIVRLIPPGCKISAPLMISVTSIYTSGTWLRNLAEQRF